MTISLSCEDLISRFNNLSFTKENGSFFIQRFHCEFSSHSSLQDEQINTLAMFIFFSIHELIDKQIESSSRIKKNSITKIENVQIVNPKTFYLEKTSSGFFLQIHHGRKLGVGSTKKVKTSFCCDILNNGDVTSFRKVSLFRTYQELRNELFLENDFLKKYFSNEYRSHNPDILIVKPFFMDREYTGKETEKYETARKFYLTNFTHICLKSCIPYFEKKEKKELRSNFFNRINILSNIFKSVYKGFHCQNLVFGDLKSDNILINSKRKPFLSDFGWSSEFQKINPEDSEDYPIWGRLAKKGFATPCMDIVGGANLLSWILFGDFYQIQEILEKPDEYNSRLFSTSYKRIIEPFFEFYPDLLDKYNNIIMTDPDTWLNGCISLLENKLKQLQNELNELKSINLRLCKTSEEKKEDQNLNSSLDSNSEEKKQDSNYSNSEYSDPDTAKKLTSYIEIFKYNLVKLHYTKGAHRLIIDVAIEENKLYEDSINSNFALVNKITSDDKSSETFKLAIKEFYAKYPLFGNFHKRAEELEARALQVWSHYCSANP